MVMQLHGSGLVLIITFSAALALLAIIIGVLSRRSAIEAGGKNHVMELGGEAQATILSIQARGRAAAGAGRRRVKLRLEVMPPGRPSFEAKVVENLSEAAVAELQPGSEVTVKYDHSRPKAVTLAVGGAPPTVAGSHIRHSGSDFAADIGRAAEVFGAPGSGFPASGPWSAIKLTNRQRWLVITSVAMGLLLVGGIAAALFYSGYSDMLDDATAPVSGLRQQLDKGLSGSYEMVEAAVTDPYMPSADTVFEPSPGNKWVLVTLTVRNTDDAAIDLSWAYLQLLADNGVIYAPVVVQETPKGFEASGLAPGAKYGGDLVFEIPEGARPLAVQDSFRDYEFPLSAATPAAAAVLAPSAAA